MNVRKLRLLKLSLLLFSLVSTNCTAETSEWDKIEITPGGEGAQEENLKRKVFESLNLDYPGLEKVKQRYEEGDVNAALQELLKYYRSRNGIVNPLMDYPKTLSKGDAKKADDALELKFYIKNYTDKNGESYRFPVKEDGQIDWSYQPSKEGEFRSQLFRMHWVVSQGKAYYVTKNEDYVKSWIRVYGDFLRQYAVPEGKSEGMYGSYGPLPVCERLSGAMDMFFYSIQSANFSPEWLSAFLVGLDEQTEHIRRNYYSSGGKTNNITIAQEVTVEKAGILFPEFKKSKEWTADATQRLSDEMKRQFLPDGMLWEVDLSYHIGTVANFYDVVVLVQANHCEDILPASYLESMRKSTSLLMNLMYPDYTLEAFNDTRRTWTKSTIVKNLNKYVRMFPDNKEMQWVATSGKSGVKPTHLTQAFTSSGYYVLRDGWDKSSTMLIHTNNPTAAWHNQGDNGTFSIYRNGRRFFPDSGCYTYDNGATREWYRSAKQHNTLTLDDKPIKDADRNGTFLKMEELKGNTAVVVTSNQSYPTLNHRRAIFHVDRKFFVIVDEGVGTASGKVSVNFHLCEGTDSEVVYDLDQCGAHTAFADGNNMMYRTFSDSPITAKGFMGKVSENIHVTKERKSYEVNIQKASDKTARFITVLLPIDKKLVDVAAQFTEPYSADKIAVEVTVAGKKYQLECKL